MSSVQFNFPPESYSAVYKVDGTTNANVLVAKCNLTDSCELSVSPAGASLNSSSSLFSCFHCAFQNGIKFTRRGKHKKENHTINHKVYLVKVATEDLTHYSKGILSQISKQKAGAVPPLPEVSIDVNGVT